MPKFRARIFRRAVQNPDTTRPAAFPMTEPVNEGRFVQTAVPHVQSTLFGGTVGESVRYSRSLVVPVTHQLQGEYPHLETQRLIAYRQQIPQVAFGIDLYREYIMGHDIIINSDDQEAKDYLEQFCYETDFFKRLRNMVDMTLLFGTGMLVRNLEKDGSYFSVEDFDVATIFRVERDKYGNLRQLIQRVENVDWITISEKPQSGQPVVDDLKVFRFREDGRSFYGRSILSTLAKIQDSRGRAYYPLCEKMIAITDAYTSSVENFVAPRTFIESGGWSEKDKKEFKSRYEAHIPGETMMINKLPDVAQIKYETNVEMQPFIDEFNRTFAIGLGVPVDVLKGDQASLASLSEVMSSFMKVIYAYQAELSRFVVGEIFHDMLRRHPSGKWFDKDGDDVALREANVSITFKTEIPQRLTPEQVATRVSLGIWTILEARQYDRMMGSDLFDEDGIEKSMKMQDDAQQASIDSMNSDNDGVNKGGSDKGGDG